jgi:hypothetical protein
MATEPQLAPDPKIRASDDDRERTVRLLGDHFAAGRLDLSEFEARTTAANAAVTVGDLAGLCTDLPTAAARSGPAGRMRIEPTVGARTERPTGANLHRRIGALHTSWVSWLATGLICIAIWAATSISRGTLVGFWPVWVIGPWGAVLLARGVSGQRVGCGRRMHW